MVNPNSALSSLIYPNECRVRGISYNSPLKIVMGWLLNGIEQPDYIKVIGQVPIMVQSNRCSLRNLNPKQLVKKQEDFEVNLINC